MGGARYTAVKGLCQVFGAGGYSNIVLDRLMESGGLSPADKGFCAALFYGVIERAITLDHVVAHYSKLPPSKVSCQVRQILRSGVYQLLYMPSVEKYAAVNETVSLAAMFGQRSAAGFVNGVLRAFIRDKLAVPPCGSDIERLSVQYSLPEELIAFWQRHYPEKTADILEGTRGPAPAYLRVNTIKTTAAGLISALDDEGITAREVPGVPDALRCDGGDLAASCAFGAGLYHIQDVSSQLCAAALEARPGMTVGDFCSAPGGKSFTIAEMMENTGELLAMDLHGHRLRLVEQGAARLGLSIIKTLENNAARFCQELPAFDRILCDVVCSGYGVIRRKPEIRYKPFSDIDGLPQIQYNILATSAKYLKEGGRLVYSTCTLNPAENGDVVERFLREHQDFSMCGEIKTYINSGRLDCDGFFVAALAKE